MPTLHTDRRFLKLQDLLHELSQDYNLAEKDLLSIADITIPLSIFSAPLSPLELVSRFLKENGLKNSEIASVLNRSRQGIYQALKDAEKKDSKSLIIVPGRFDIPLAAISGNSEKLSLLESIVSFLKDNHSLTFSKISHLLNRDQRTIWTVYRRAKKK